jgi:hypothetical protein
MISFIFIKSTMSSSMNDDAVSHGGMLRNMLRQGFTPIQCLFETGDNSLAAFAQEAEEKRNAQAAALVPSMNDPMPPAAKMCMWICTMHNILCFSDNAGIKKDLGAAFRFHERSLPSLQHGRFGIGSKFAMVCLTLLKSIVHIFTRPNEGDPIKQLTIDYPRAIETDRLTINPHGIEMDRKPTWDKYAIDPAGKGTVIHLPSDRSIVQEIVSMITTDKVENNLLFAFGTTYHKFLSDNTTYQINVDDKTYDVVPIDRLCLDKVDEKMEVTLNVCYHPENHSNIRAYYQDPVSNKFGFRVKMNQKGKNNFMIGELPDDFVSLGLITVQLAYSSDWIALLAPKLTHCGIHIPKDKTKASLRMALGGTEIMRNGKVVKVLPVKRPSQGDTPAYSFHENTKVRILFDAVKSDQILDDDSKTMDDVFNTQVNKSELNVDTISKSVWEAVRQMRWDYGQHIYKRSPVYAAAAEAVENSDSEEEPIAPAKAAVSSTSVNPKSAAKPAVMPAAKPAVMPAAKPAVMPAVIPAAKPAVMPAAKAASSSNPIIIPKPVVAASPSVAAEPSSPTATSQEQVTSVTQIHAHIRSTSKCPRDVIKLLEGIYTTYGPHLNAIYDRADHNTRAKLVDDFNALLRIEDLLKEFSNNE